jgi:hypothetical protein
MIKGMEFMGATFVKNDATVIIFNAKAGSEIDNREKIDKAAEAFKKTFGIKLEVNIIS